MNPNSINHICFICEWNEGRSAHLELSTRFRLRAAGSRIRVTSAGLSQGGRVNPLRREFLKKLGVPASEIGAHRSTVFGTPHAEADLILVSELQMKHRILESWPHLAGKVMTVRGFLQGQSPEDETISDSDAHIEDAAGHSREEKLGLYDELEVLAKELVSRILKPEKAG